MQYIKKLLNIKKNKIQKVYSDAEIVQFVQRYVRQVYVFLNNRIEDLYAKL